MSESEGLLAHLKKFPSLISIYPMTEVEQALFIKDLGLWKVDHRKLCEGVAQQIPSRIDTVVKSWYFAKPKFDKTDVGILIDMLSANMEALLGAKQK